MREREVRKGGFDGKNVLDLCMAGYSHLALDKKSKLKMGDCFRNAKHGIISNMICNLVRFCLPACIATFSCYKIIFQRLLNCLNCFYYTI